MSEQHIDLAQALLKEYTKRYKRIHKTAPVIQWLADHPPVGIPVQSKTHFAVAIKDPSLRVLDASSSVSLGPDRQGGPLTWELVRDIGVKSGCITDQDLNIIDWEKVGSSDPFMVQDLPAGGRRLMQNTHGYVATVVSGKITYENGNSTAERPGSLVRSVKDNHETLELIS